MAKRTVESAAVRAARVQLRKRLKAVAKERDALRQLESDCDDLAGSCDDALESLQSAIEALSRYA